MNINETNLVRQVNTNQVTPFLQYNLTILEQHIGKIFLDARTRCHLTQKELADLAKISKSYVGHIENLRPHSQSQAPPKPDRDKLIRLINALNSKLPPNERLNMNSLLTTFGHAPLEEVQKVRREVVASDRDGFDDKDLDDIAEFIAFKKIRKAKEQEESQK